MNKLSIRTFSLRNGVVQDLGGLDVDPNNPDDLEALRITMNQQGIVVAPVDYKSNEINMKIVKLMLDVQATPAS